VPQVTSAVKALSGVTPTQNAGATLAQSKTSTLKALPGVTLPQSTVPSNAASPRDARMSATAKNGTDDAVAAASILTADTVLVKEEVANPWSLISDPGSGAVLESSPAGEIVQDPVSTSVEEKAGEEANTVQGECTVAEIDQVVVMTPEQEIAQLRIKLQEQESLIEQYQTHESKVGTPDISQNQEAGDAPAAQDVSSAKPAAPKLHPDTIPEMEVVDDAHMTSNFTLRAKRPITAKSRNKYKAVDGPHDALSEDMRIFMVSWRKARDGEIKALIIQELRRTYITLAKDDEQCKELNIVLASLADGKGSNKGICEYLRERFRSSFLLRPEEVVFCRPSRKINCSASARSEPVLVSSPIMDATANVLVRTEDGTAEEILPGTVVPVDTGEEGR